MIAGKLSYGIGGNCLIATNWFVLFGNHKLKIEIGVAKKLLENTD